MFPPAFTPPMLRARLVRGLDLAVEFATLGEYGVEEVELVGPVAADSGGWDWPERCGELRARGVSGLPPRPRRPL